MIFLIFGPFRAKMVHPISRHLHPRKRAYEKSKPYIYTSYFRRGGKSVVLEYTNGVRSERIIKYYYRLNRDHFSML